MSKDLGGWVVGRWGGWVEELKDPLQNQVRCHSSANSPLPKNLCWQNIWVMRYFAPLKVKRWLWNEIPWLGDSAFSEFHSNSKRTFLFSLKASLSVHHFSIIFTVTILMILFFFKYVTGWFSICTADLIFNNDQRDVLVFWRVLVKVLEDELLWRWYDQLEI